MFDVGFSELLMVAVIALIVLGPERLPRVARVAGLWVGRARRTLASVKQEIDRELHASELSDSLHKASMSTRIDKILEEEPPKRPAAVADSKPSDLPKQD